MGKNKNQNNGVKYSKYAKHGAKGNKAPYRGKNSQKGSRQDRRAENIADTAAKMSDSNPVSWYTKYTQFAHDAATIPFSLPLGAPITVDWDIPFKDTVPGLMRLVFSPTVGVSADNTSPMNRSSINYYAKIRSTQKAFGDYDHQDLTIMMLAIDSAAMFHALGRRIYGLLTAMTPVNRYYPTTLITASGIGFTATQKQIQDFRAFLNQYAVMLEQYAIPKGISLMERHQWMCEGIYTDGTSSRAQTYMFVPRGFWKYNNTAAKGSQLDYVTYIKSGQSSSLYTLDEFMNIGQSLIQAMTNDADFALMSGDLYAYYGQDAVFKLPYIEEKYAILPAYDEVVLSQIENADIMGDWAMSYLPVISQNPDVNAGAIIFEPETASPYRLVSSKFINMHKESPTPDDVIEGTRLKCVATRTTAKTNKILSCASEIVHRMDIFEINPTTGNPRFRVVDGSTWSFAKSDSVTGWREGLGDWAHLNQFDWAPRTDVFFLDDSVTPNVEWYIGTSWDVDNMTVLKEDYLSTIHEACLYSLFDTATH